MQRILITGAAGFIGFHLSKALLELNHHVVGVDNFITGQKNNIAELEKFSGFTFLKHDVRDRLDVKDPLDYIFHFASPASPADFQKLGMLIAFTNTLGTKNLLDLAAAKNAYFIFASTSEVYGDPLVHPQKEDYFGNVNPTGERSCYDESKRLGESIMADYWRREKIRGNIVRIFNTYGPNMRIDDGRIISNFICQTIGNIPLTVYGDGTQTRSLCYVDDLVEIIIKIALGKNSEEIYNIGNDNELKVADIAKKVLEVAQKKLEIKYLPERKDEPRQRRPDLSKVKRDFGWEPKVNLDEGLGKTFDFFSNSNT